MFDFAWPWFALLLPLPLLVRRWWRARDADAGEDSTRLTLRHPALARLRAAFATSTPRPTLAARLRLGALWAVWVLGVLALMNPRWLEAHTEQHSPGYDLMLAVDGSRSMEALDFSSGNRQITRMAVVKGVIDRFIAARENDRIGLILFGDQAYLLAPLTRDRAAVRTMVRHIATRMAGDGTAIGDAIGLAVKKLRERPPGARVLILITDGENTSGTLPPRTAAELARQEGVRIYAIGVGSTGLVPFRENGVLQYANMQIDEPLLKSIAQVTGGAYYRATDAAALDAVYRQIDRLQRTDAEPRTVLVPTPLYRWPLALALLPLAWLGLHPDGNRRRREARP